MKVKMYCITVWYDSLFKTVLGVFSEDYCRAYCEQYAGKNDGFHVSCVEVIHFDDE